MNLHCITQQRINTRHLAKLRANRTINCGDIAIYRFFSRWRPPPSWIFEITNFNGGTRREWRIASSCQISWLLVKPLPRYGDFWIFQDGDRPPYWFVAGTLGPPTQTTWWSLYHCAKFGWNRYSSFDSVDVYNVLRVSLENSYSFSEN